MSYDVEYALAELAKVRNRRDTDTRAIIELGDTVANRIETLLGPESVETAGLSLVMAAGALSSLIDQGLTNGVALVNLLAMAGQRLVGDARAADQAVRR